MRLMGNRNIFFRSDNNAVSVIIKKNYENKNLFKTFYYRKLKQLLTRLWMMFTKTLRLSRRKLTSSNEQSTTTHGLVPPQGR